MLLRHPLRVLRKCLREIPVSSDGRYSLKTSIKRFSGKGYSSILGNSPQSTNYVPAFDKYLYSIGFIVLYKNSSYSKLNTILSDFSQLYSIIYTLIMRPNTYPALLIMDITKEDGFPEFKTMEKGKHFTDFVSYFFYFSGYCLYGIIMFVCRLSNIFLSFSKIFSSISLNLTPLN